MQPEFNGTASKKLADMIASHEGILAQLKEFQSLANLCDRLMEIRDGQAEHTDRLDAVEVTLEKIEKDQIAAKALEALLRDHDFLREDFVFKYGKKPTGEELVLLYDRVAELKASFEELPVLIKAQVQQNLEGLLTQVSQAISAIRLRIVTVKAGIEFNADWHEVVGTEAVDNPQQVGKVIRVVRPLFMYEGKPFRPAEVLVGVLQEPKEVLNVGICEDAHSVGN